MMKLVQKHLNELPRRKRTGYQNQNRLNCRFWCSCRYSWLFVTWYGSIGWHKSTKSLSGKRFNWLARSRSKTIDKNRLMSFSIRVPSLITPVHCITQTEEPFSKYLSKINYTYLTPSCLLPLAWVPIFTRKLILHNYLLYAASGGELDPKRLK